jgi:hypothetical protein
LKNVLTYSCNLQIKEHTDLNQKEKKVAQCLSRNNESEKMWIILISTACYSLLQNYVIDADSVR